MLQSDLRVKVNRVKSKNNTVIQLTLRTTSSISIKVFLAYFLALRPAIGPFLIESHFDLYVAL